MVNKAVTILKKFQSTRPAWGETHLHQVAHAAVSISIHSPRVGRDA